MPPELLVWLVFGFVALVALHELTHIAIARGHGHACVCVAINPIGVAVVFEDVPNPRYWIAQVVLPAIVTWLVCYAWLHFTLTYDWGIPTSMAVEDMLDRLPAIVTLLTALTSSGDLLSALADSRQRVLGDERILRDFAVLNKIPNLVLFTAHGRRRWQAIWTDQKAGRVKRSAAAAS